MMNFKIDDTDYDPAKTYSIESMTKKKVGNTKKRD